MLLMILAAFYHLRLENCDFVSYLFLQEHITICDYYYLILTNHLNLAKEVENTRTYSWGHNYITNVGETSGKNNGRHKGIE